MKEEKQLSQSDDKNSCVLPWYFTAYILLHLLYLAFNVTSPVFRDHL